MSSLTRRNPKTYPLTTGQRNELLHALFCVKGPYAARLKKRIHAILDLDDGVDRRVIANRYGCSRDVVLVWYHKFLKYGDTFLYSYDKYKPKAPENEP
jgi:hypothetical protein